MPFVPSRRDTWAPIRPFPPPALMARFRRLQLEHQLHPLAARTPLPMTWRTTWPLYSVKQSANICQEDQVAEARQVEDRQVEFRRVEE